MSFNLKTRLGLGLYNLAWKVVLPGLKVSPRLREGWDERLFRNPTEGEEPIDVWFQAASVGEAYLAVEIVKNLSSISDGNVLITSGTKQGLDITKEEIGKFKKSIKSFNIKTSYFPFDKPSLMIKALNHWQPKLLILLETEIWPGLLAACRSKKIPVLILNGRLSERSLKGYLKFKSFLNQIKPEKIYAVSSIYADRYREIFGEERVDIMNNIKFDRIRLQRSDSINVNPLEKMIPPDIPFLVLGSIRKEEEADIQKVISKASLAFPEVVIGLFPRHHHRVKSWGRALDKSGMKWVLRSRIKGSVPPGTTILWDLFGELLFAYDLAQAVFVGGSLKPCGGQNFLEPLGKGLVPCIGPYWDNFSWVGQEIISLGLVKKVADWKELRDVLGKDLKSGESKTSVLKRMEDYVRERMGGTTQACEIIERNLRK